MVVRGHVPFLGMGDHVPDVEPLVAAIQDGEFNELAGDGWQDPGSGHGDGA